MNKKDALRFHKLAALSNSLLIELDEMKPTAPIGANLHQKAKEFIEALEPFLSSTYDSEIVRSTTYLTDLSHKIDTVIRKNFEFIEK